MLTRLWESQLARLRTSRGIATTIVAVVSVLFSVASSEDAAATLVGLCILFPAIWWIDWAVVGLFIRFWRRLITGKPPQISVGRPWQGGGTRKQLREDGNARFFTDRGGILLRRRVWFIASGTPPFEIHPATYARVQELQEVEPQHVGEFRDRSYWWYGDTVYWTNGPYTATDVKALLFARERQDERRLEHAHALLSASGSPAKRKREPIPRDVKHAVWARDEGRCVECDSDFDIQYDHVIPLSMGGANTVENLQLLCARCNQRKGGRL